VKISTSMLIALWQQPWLPGKLLNLYTNRI